MDLSPKEKSPTSPKEIMSVRNSHPIIRIQSFRTPRDDKQLGMSTSGSSKTLTTANSNRKKSQPDFPAIINSISDFFNKDQVSKAIASVNSLDGKLQMIDLILKRREEIQAIEEQMKLENAAPIIQKFTENFKMKLAKKYSKNGGVEGSAFRKALKKLNSDLRSEISLPTTPTLTNYDQLTQQQLPEGSKGSLDGESADEVDPNLPGQDRQTFKRRGGLNEKTIIAKISHNQVALLLKNKNMKEAELKKKLQEEMEEEERQKEKGKHPTRNSNKKYTILDTRNFSKKMARLKNLELAGKTLEHDLYKYLIKHDQSAQHKKLILDTPSHGKLAIIESNVLKRYNHFQFQKKQAPYQVPRLSCKNQIEIDPSNNPSISRSTSLESPSPTPDLNKRFSLPQPFYSHRKTQSFQPTNLEPLNSPKGVSKMK